MCVLFTLLFAPPTFSSCSLAHLRLAAGNAFIKLVKDRKELSLAFSDFLQVSLVSQVGTYVHTYLQVTARTSASFLQTHPQPNCSPSLPHLTHTPHTSHPHPTHTSSTPHPYLTHTSPTLCTLPFPPGPLPSCAYAVPPETTQRTRHL